MADNIDINLALDTAASVKSVGDMKKALKELKSQIAQVGEGSAEFKKLSAAAGDLNDRIGDTADATKAFTGTGIEKLTASFGFLKEGFENFDPGKLKTAFAGIGAAMKAIPLILIVEGIKYLIENFDKLSKGSGFLGKALRLVGDIIQWVIDLIYKMTDAIGLTNSELDKQGEAIGKNAEAGKEALDKQTKAYDRQISKLKASGKSTVQLEKLKQKAIIDTNLLVAKQIEAYVRAGGALDDEKKKLLTASLETIKDAKAQEYIIDQDNEKKQSDLAQKQFEENQKIIDKTKELKIKSIEDETERALAQEQDNFIKAAKDINNSTASKKIKDAALIALEISYNKDVKDINDKAFKDKKDKEEDERKKKEKEDEELKKKQEDKDKAILKLKNDDALAIAALNVSIATQNGGDILKAKIDQMELQKNIELQNAELTENQIAEIKDKYRVSEQDATDKAEKAKRDSQIAIATEAQNSLQALSDLTFLLKSSNLKKGSVEEEQAARKQFAVNKALQLGLAVINGYKAITTSLASSPVAIGPIPNPAGIVALITTAATTALNIAKIASSQYQPSGGAAAGPSAPSINIPSAPSGGASATTNFNRPEFFGLGKGTQPGQTPPPQKVYVTESDITKTQNKVSVIESGRNIV